MKRAAYLIAPIFVLSVPAVAQVTPGVPFATNSVAGKARCDGTTTNCGAGGVITATGGGGPVPGASCVVGSDGNALNDTTAGTGLTCTGTTLNQTNVINAQSGASYTIATTDANKTVRMTNGSATTVTLLAGATAGNGFSTYLICDAGCTVNRSGADTINGATSLVLAAHQGAPFDSDGTAAWTTGVIAAVDPSNAANLTSGTVASARGGAGTINGIVKANGSGVTSAATAGSDYINGSGASGNCMQWGASNAAGDAGAPCGTGGGNTTGVLSTVCGGCAAGHSLEKTSDTALATISGLTLNLAAGHSYVCRATLFSSTPSAGGLKVSLVADSVTNPGLTVTSIDWAALFNATVSSNQTALAASQGTTSAVVMTLIQAGVVVNAGGNLAVQAAQNASSATTTDVFTNSFLECSKVA